MMVKYSNGESTQNMIITSAHRSFYHKGFKNTTFQDIVVDSHVSKTSIIYHFKTKDALNSRGIETMLDKIYEDAEMLLQSL